MIYKEFIEIVAGHKKNPDWVARSHITVNGASGRHIIKDGNRIILDKDIGPGPDIIVITFSPVNPRWAVEEVFEMFNARINR